MVVVLWICDTLTSLGNWICCPTVCRHVTPSHAVLREEPSLVAFLRQGLCSPTSNVVPPNLKCQCIRMLHTNFVPYPSNAFVDLDFLTSVVSCLCPWSSRTSLENHSSTMSVHVHFHDGELAQLATVLIKAFLPLHRLSGMCKAGAAIFSGRAAEAEYERKRDEYMHAYRVAVNQLAQLRKFMTAAQREDIYHALKVSVTSCSCLTNGTCSLFSIVSVTPNTTWMIQPWAGAKHKNWHICEIRLCSSVARLRYASNFRKPHTAESHNL